MNKLKKVNNKTRKFLGVCGGISKHLDPAWDPTLVRIIWVVLTLVNPIMIILYFGLAIALNTEDDKSAV